MNFIQSLRTLLLAIVLSIGISYAYAAWSPPSNTPPGGNIDAPVNVGGVPQAKAGSLWSNSFIGSAGSGYFGGNLQVVGNIQVPTLCLNGDCRSAWPSGSGGTITGVTAGTGLSGGGTTGTVTLNVKTTSQSVYNCIPTGHVCANGSCTGISFNTSCTYTTGDTLCNDGSTWNVSEACTYVGKLVVQ
jgi:hypothetical protein